MTPTAPVAPPRVIDVHAHVVPLALFSGTSDLPEHLEVREVGGRPQLFVKGRALTSAVGEFFDASRIAAEAKAAGVDHSVLSPWVQLVPLGVGALEASKRCAALNEALAQFVLDAPDVFSALGAVPIEHPDDATSVLHEALEAGLCGVELPAGALSAADLDRLDPFFSAAEARRAILFVHPSTLGLGLSCLEHDYLWNTVGNPVETTTAAAHLALGGVMERHRDLRVVLSHGGGALGALSGRMQHGQRAVAAAHGRLTEPLDRSLARFYVDTVVHGAVHLRRSIEDFGATRVLLGTDRPFDMGVERPALEVEGLGVGDDVVRGVLGGNAERLLNEMRERREQGGRS